MNKLFNIKRTKMVDEAARGHNPSAFGRGILSALLIFIISNVISNIITTVPSTIYYVILSMQNGTYEKIEAAILNGNSALAAQIFYDMIGALPSWAIMLELLTGGVLFGAVIIYWVKFEKRKIATLGIRKGKIPLEILIGVLIGFLITLFTFLIAFLSGTISLKVNSFSLATLFFPLGFLVYAAGEEIFIHGFITTMLARDIKPISAVILTSFVFAIINFSYTFDFVFFINTFLFNFLLGTLVFKRGNIWGAIFTKSTWGILCANLLGMGACGFSPMASILDTVYGNGRIISGSVTLGFESSVALTIILTLGSATLLLLKTKRSEKSAIEIEYFK